MAVKTLLLDTSAVEIPYAPGYYVTKDGVIYSTKFSKVRKMKQHISTQGRPSCGRPVRLIQRAVACAFISNPDNLTDVNHKDGDKLNNSVDNLEWCSRTENLRHSLANGLHANPEKAVIGVEESTGNGVWFKSQALASKFGFTQANISKCLAGDRPRHKGFTWSFA